MLCTDEGAEINAILAAERKIFVGTSCGKVVVLNSETKMFLVAYSWHEGKIDKLLLLPDETKPSICAEIPLNKSPEKPLNSSQTHSVSIINNIHSIPNPEPNAVMIISIGEGRVQHDVTPRSTNEVTNSHLMIWKS